jgi:hypothetical protein
MVDVLAHPIRSNFIEVDGCIVPNRGRLSEQQEAFDGGSLPDHIGDIDGRFAPC